MHGSPLPQVPISAPGSSYDVAVVGGGFSGVMTAVHLLRRCRPNTSILLIEPNQGWDEGSRLARTRQNICSMCQPGT